MDFKKYCALCDLFLSIGADEDTAEILAQKVWDIMGVEATDKDLISNCLNNLIKTA